MDEFLTADFWNSRHTHLASAAGEDENGLRSWIEDRQGLHGWCLFQTSGTEGGQKWVALTKEALLCSARAVNEHYSVTMADRWVLALPLWHVGGFGVLARAFATGIPVEKTSPKWDALAFCAKVAETEATLTSLVPTQVFDLVAARLPAPTSLRVALVGGGGLSQEIRKSAERLGWPLRTTYGMTETASQVASEPLGGGRMEVLPIWSTQVDSDGVLSVRGAALAKGYVVSIGGIWRWDAIDPEKGLQTRDRVTLVRQDSKCYLSFVARKSGFVKILGELVALEPLQSRLDDLRLQISGEGDAAVCDVPDTRKGSKLVLVVSRMTHDTAFHLLATMNRDLRPFEQLGEVRSVHTISRSHLGKLKLEELRMLIQSGQ